MEYDFTCTPLLPLYLLNQHRDMDVISYLDADIYFVSSPAAIVMELGDASVMIIGHRYSPHLSQFARYGKYNVGMLTFRNNDQGRTCLKWWRQRCLEWCYERLEPTRFADQKYLDDWPQRFAGIVELQHKGANLAPWNLAGYHLPREHGRLYVDDDPLIFYHFHRMRCIGPYLYDHGLAQYDATVNRVVAKRLYAPYLRQLRYLMQKFADCRTDNLRLGGPSSKWHLLRTLVYGHTLLNVGPITQQLHLEPLARPLLYLNNLRKRAA